MTRFLSIKTALGEAAALQGRQPTHDQFAEIENVLRKQIVIDLQSGKAGICYADGDVVELADFVADALKYPGIEAR